MNRIILSIICAVCFTGIVRAQSLQSENTVTQADSLSYAGVEFSHSFDGSALIETPDIPQPLPGSEQRGVDVDELADSAAIISQTQYLLERQRAGTLLYPDYGFETDAERANTPKAKFSHSLIAAAQRQDLVGLMGVERAMLGYSISYGALSIEAHASADKYATFRNLTTVYGIGGSISLDVTDWMSVTAFGNYYNKAPFMSMAAYPYVNTSNYGGYMTIKPSGTFGMSLGARRDYDPITRRYYTNPIIAPQIKINKAVFSVDLGPMVNEVFHIFNRPQIPQGAMMPPGPRLIKPAGPIK